MADSIAKSLDGVPLKMLQMRGETALKKFQKAREAHGRVLERACEIAGLSKKEVAAAIGVDQPSQLTAWFTGSENPQTWRFEQHPALGKALIVAMAEARRDDSGVVVTTSIQVQTRRKTG